MRGGSVLSVGYSRKAPHTKAFYGTSIHAEYDAITKSESSVAQAKMFVYRFGNEFEIKDLRISRPCTRCQQEIKKANIPRVIYLDDQSCVRSEDFRTVPAAARPEMKHLIFGGIAGIY